MGMRPTCGFLPRWSCLFLMGIIILSNPHGPFPSSALLKNHFPSQPHIVIHQQNNNNNNNNNNNQNCRAGILVDPFSPFPWTPGVSGTLHFCDPSLAKQPLGTYNLSWDFGDGSIAAGSSSATATVHHAYSQGGFFLVRVTAYSRLVLNTNIDYLSYATLSIPVLDCSFYDVTGPLVQLVMLPSVPALSNSRERLPAVPSSNSSSPQATAGDQLVFTVCRGTDAANGNQFDESLYQWSFGDGTVQIQSGRNGVLDHIYSYPGSFIIQVTWINATTSDITSSTPTTTTTTTTTTLSTTTTIDGSPRFQKTQEDMEPNPFNSKQTERRKERGKQKREEKSKDDAEKEEEEAEEVEEVEEEKNKRQKRQKREEQERNSDEMTASIRIQIVGQNIEECETGIAVASPLSVGTPHSFAACGPALDATLAPPYAFEWSFGDSSTSLASSTSLTMVHAYSAPGIYLVDLLTVFQDPTIAPLYHSTSAFVVDCPPPPALNKTLIRISLSQQNQTLSHSTSASQTQQQKFYPTQLLIFQLCVSHLETLPTDTALLYHWYFGDGTAGSPSPVDLVAQHRYATTGTYVVECRILDEQGQGTVRQFSTLVTIDSVPPPPLHVSSSPSSSQWTAWQVFGLVAGILSAIAFVAVLVILLIYFAPRFRQWAFPAQASQPLYSSDSSPHETLLSSRDSV